MPQARANFKRMFETRVGDLSEWPWAYPDQASRVEHERLVDVSRAEVILRRMLKFAPGIETAV
jgi:hypothetical protein